MNKEKVDIRYLAGLFEGEGYAGIVRHTSKCSYSGYCYEARLSVRMTDAEPVIAFYDYFGGRIDIDMIHNRKGGNHHDQLGWSVRGLQARDAAKQLIEFIITPRKRGALSCIIQYGETIKLSGGRIARRADKHAYKIRQALYEKCLFFNGCGFHIENRNNNIVENILQQRLDDKQLHLI